MQAINISTINLKRRQFLTPSVSFFPANCAPKILAADIDPNTARLNTVTI